MSRIDRFWAKVEKTDGCWLWTAATNGGYGIIGNGKRRSPLRAHRVSWELANGPIPDGLFVCHRCDVNYPVGDRTYRRCVRPDHLFLGTVVDNQRDMADKGRAASGDRNGSRIYRDKMPRGASHPWAKHPEKVPRGERAGGAKLTAADITTIRRLRKAGVSQSRVAAQFGTTQSNVSMIEHRKAWAHVQEAVYAG